MPPHSVPSAAIRVWHEDADHIQASVQRVFLLHARGAASPQNVDRLVGNFEAFVRANPTPLGFLFTMTGTAKPPSDAERKRIADMMSRHSDAMAAMAICLPLSGFTGAALRSVVFGVFVMSRPTYPVKVFGAEDEAGRWMSESLDVQFAAIHALCEHAKTRIEQISHSS